MCTTVRAGCCQKPCSGCLPWHHAAAGCSEEIQHPLPAMQHSRQQQTCVSHDCCSANSLGKTLSPTQAAAESPKVCAAAAAAAAIAAHAILAGLKQGKGLPARPSEQHLSPLLLASWLAAERAALQLLPCAVVRLQLLFIKP